MSFALQNEDMLIVLSKTVSWIFKENQTRIS